MRTDLVTDLLPVLGRSVETGFNVFDVMHHGVHEKQISNVFRWLLDSAGSHKLRERFVTIFMEEVNRARPPDDQLPVDGYSVSQEVNTSGMDESGDIADLVLESASAVVVIENYLLSDGHGHGYHRYLSYGGRDSRRAAVVLLCQHEDRSLQIDGWENAAVVTYATLIGRLHAEVARDHRYRATHPDVHWFIEQMHRKFVIGRGPVENEDVLKFVEAMCDTGAADRFGAHPHSVAAEQFAADVAEQARQRFGEGRALLREVKQRLKSYATGRLTEQLDATHGEGFVGSVSARFKGVYQWSINFELTGAQGVGAFPLQLKFGPSAWFAIEKDDENWKNAVLPETVDYSRLFITRPAVPEIRQSRVALREVLDGLEPTDRRLHDEIVQLLRVEVRRVPDRPGFH